MSGDSSNRDRQQPVDYDPFGGVTLERVVPTTEPQREVWLADRLGQGASLAYNESITIRLRGELRREAMRAALQELLQRHEALRGTLGGNGLEFCIGKQAVLDLVDADHSGAPESTQRAAIAAAKRRAVETPFVLEQGPLVRVELLTLSREQHLVIFTAHHIVCDGWSFGVLVRDLLQIYAEQIGASTEPLAPPPSFGDYALEQDAMQGGDKVAADESYWLAQFHDAVPVMDLPVDRPRGVTRTFDSRREDLVIDAGLLKSLRRLGGDSGAGLFATTLGLFSVLLQRISGGEDLVIGVPAAGQSGDGLHGLVGHCVNLLPLRLRIDASSSVEAAIVATQAAVLDAYEHQSCTMGSLLQKLAVTRDPGRPTLVSVMFNIDSALDVEHACPGLTVEVESNPRSYEAFEIFVNAVVVGDELRLECQYNASLFDAGTIRGWLGCYETLLRSACASPGDSVRAVACASPGDLDVLARWNDTDRAISGDAMVHRLFEEQVGRSPESPAVVWRGTTLTYAEVDRQANRIARALLDRGTKSGALIGLHLDRVPDLVTAMLGIMKAGAAYVPLDPSYPRERLQFMVEDAELALVVSNESLAQGLVPPQRCLLLDADRDMVAAQSDAALATAVDQERLAYVIYTSGSTGRPNGVCVHHRAAVNFLKSMAAEPGLTAADRLVAVTTPSFDIALNELFCPLTVGATVVLASDEEAGDGALLDRLLSSSGATVMQATPATWRLLIGAGWRGGPRFRAWCGGEALSVDLAEQLLDRVGELWNMYGPTETTVWSSCGRITEVTAGISIGKPIANTSIWVLDGEGGVCPIGVPGEIWIGGDGVSSGYLGRAQLTAARFCADPMSAAPGAKIYRTGDRGRWRADGSLQHLGRLDQQVKVRGYRIEPGEIESRLSSHPSVQACVALVREDQVGDVRLVAYFVAESGKSADLEDLRAHLAGSLPDYMVPQHLVAIPEFPLLPNGKLDRKSLPAPDTTRRLANEFVAPTSATECGVAADMEAALGMEGVGMHDDFFVLGGHSLLAAQLTYRLNNRFGADLSMRAVFECPTVALLAARIDDGAAEPPSVRAPIKRQTEQSRAPASFMQERLWLLERMNPGRVVYHAPSAHRLRGAMDEVAFQRAFDEVVRRQPSLRTYFENHRHGLDQCVRDEVVCPLFPAEDLAQLPSSQREPQLLERLEALTNETFDLASGPLFRARMFRLADDEHVLFFMPHHIIWDGWSFDLLYQEMSQLYAAYVAGNGTPLSPLAVTYTDFSVWHRDWMAGAECQGQIEFWRERLAQASTSRPLPTDRPRKQAMSGDGATEWIAIAKDKSEKLHELAAQCGATQFVATLSVFSVLLHDFARDSAFVVGTPVRARMAAEVESIMGYFNNLLLLPLEVDPNESFMDLLKRVKQGVVKSFAVPDVPLERLEQSLTTASGKSADVLYQALFSFQDVRQRPTRWGALSHSMIPLFQRGATEDLGVWFVESFDGLQGGMTYNTDLFDPGTAKWLVQRYAALLDRILASPDATLAELVGAPSSAVRERIAARDSRSPSSTAAQDGEVREIGARPRYEAPTSNLEAQLAAAWRRVLGVERVGRLDNFFDLGGNSLGVLNLITEFENATAIRLDPGDVVRLPTVARLAERLEMPPQLRSAELVALREGGERNLFLIHDGEGSTLPYLNLARHLPDDVSVFGVEPPSRPGMPLAMTSIEEMAACYLEQVRKKQPAGPYRFGGLCAGGLIAYEMAVQLERLGEQVEVVAVFDGGTPQAPVKTGLPAAQRRERFQRAVAEARRGSGSAVRRACKVMLTVADRAWGALSWSVTSRFGRAWAWGRVCLLRRLLRRDKPWPGWLSSLTFQQIYVFAETRYEPRKLRAGKLILLRSRAAVPVDEGAEFVDDTPYVEIYADEALGWRDVVDEPLIVDVDGGHSSMLWEPWVQSSAGALAPLVSAGTSQRREGPQGVGGR